MEINGTKVATPNVTPRVLCDDENPCTRDTCINGTCSYVLNDELCPNPGLCITRACQVVNASQFQCVVVDQVVCPASTACADSYCAVSTGQCVTLPRVCSVDSECDFILGCFEDGNQPAGENPGCVVGTSTSLIDFCGECLGDNTACFFADNFVETTAGITAGAAVGVTIAVVVICAIAVFLSKKGYDYYKARSDMQAASMKSNPFFQNPNMSGMVPESAQLGVYNDPY